MELTQIIYTSTPFGFDENVLNGILIEARHYNKMNDITGALICRADVYVQLLEGPTAAIDATYSRIAKDNRHLDVIDLSRATVVKRMFPLWSMRDDPAHTWLWSQEDVAAGVLARASRADLLAVFARVASSPNP